MRLPNGIRRRGARFFVDVTLQGVRRTATCATLEEAVAAQARLRVELLGASSLPLGNSSSPSPPHPQATPRMLSGDSRTWTLQESFDTTRTTAWVDCNSGPKLARNAEFALEFFGASTPVRAITAQEIDRYVDHLAQAGNSNATINRKLAALSKLLTIAVQRGKLVAKPHMDRKREGRGRVRFLTEAEERSVLAILNQWGKFDHADAVTVLVDTGLRPSELWRLLLRDCDFTTGLISVWETKNGRPRSVPMTERVKAILMRRVETCPNVSEPLFPFDNFWMLHVWDRVKGHLGLERDEQFIPYALRHTCASRLVRRGVSLLVVKEWLGHTNITTTQRYAHLCPTNLLGAVKVLNGGDAACPC